MTKKREKPFSFYERDKDFYVQREKAAKESIPEAMKDIKPFKATPIPWSVSTPLLSEIQEKRRYRKTRENKKESTRKFSKIKTTSKNGNA